MRIYGRRVRVVSTDDRVFPLKQVETEGTPRCRRSDRLVDIS